jgi:SAM-dependent methyltransferase
MAASKKRSGNMSTIPSDPRIDRDSYYDRVQHYSDSRVAPFNSANRRLPQARSIERQLLINRLDLAPGLSIVDTGSGGGYVADAIAPILGDSGVIVCVDTAARFIASISPRFQRLVCGMDAIAIRTCSADRVSNLAGLHHVQRKREFFCEAFRILKPGGLLAIADVQQGSPAAAWLNGPVDRFTDIGHDGMFLAKGEFADMLDDAGFSDVTETHEEYPWRCPNRESLVGFCKDLFRMTKATPAAVDQALSDHLTVTVDAGGAALEWGLTYATGRRPAS